MKKRWLISIILTIIVVLIIIGLLFYRRTYRSKQHLVISLAEYPTYVTAPTIVIRGHVSQYARIHLTRENSTLQEVDSKNNEFEAEVQLEPGENRIRLSARRYLFEPVQGETTAVITWEPKNPPVPTLNPLPSTTNLPEVIVTGTAYPNAQVKITVVPNGSGVTKDPKSRSDASAPIKPEAPNANWGNAEIQPLIQNQTAAKNGFFQTKVRLLAPGPYNVTSQAYNSQGATSEASPNLRFVYDPDLYPLSTSVQLANPKRRIRKADIVLAHKQMTVTLQVILPRDDPAATSFLADQTNLSQFLDRIFGLRINDKRSYSAEFLHVVPQILIKDQEVTVTATALYYTGSSDLPILRGDLIFAGHRDFPFSSPGDSLTVRTDDYRIESVDPAPTVFEKNTLTWIGTGSPKLNDREDQSHNGPSAAQIKVKLGYNPFASPRNLLRLTQLTAFRALPYPATVIPQILLGLCKLIPMLWVLWLIRDSHRGNAVDDAGLRNELTSLSRLLIILSLVGTVVDIPSRLEYLIDGFYPIDFRIRAALSSLTILVLALLFLLLSLILSNRVWTTWLTRISTGIVGAAILVGLSESLYGRINNNQLLMRTVNLLILAVTFGTLFVWTVKVLRYAGLNPKHTRCLIVLAVIVTASFLLPIVMLIFRLTVPWNIFQTFSELDPLLTYALAIGLLVLLKRADTLDQRRRRHLILPIGLIIFSGYLVGTTPNLFMIPIPFILSIWMFKKFLIHDFRRCSDLEFIRDDVVSDRLRWIGEVLTYETAQHFQANIDKLKDKVSSGEMTIQDYENRKREIEQYAHEKELASTHVNGLHAKTTVLSIGPNTDDWENGTWCLKWGAALIAPFLISYLLLLLFRRAAFSEPSFGFMFSLNQTVTFVANWLLAAFFFGYFFRYIRGNSGLEKGLRTACIMITCLLATWALDVSSSSDLVLLFFRAVQTFLFFTLLGMGAFDYATFRNALRDRFRWRTFARFGNMPGFTAVVSVLITSIGVGLTTVLTGQFSQLLANLLNTALKQAPGPLP